MQGCKCKNSDKRDYLLKVIGDVIKKHRMQKNKGILLHSYEFDIPSSSLNLLEKGNRDVQITTLWKIVNSLDMTFGEFIKEVEKELPKQFSLVDDK